MKTLYIETYGCQMNFNDTEIVASIMKNSGWEIVATPEEATAVLLNTCSVRENAESRVIRRLKQYNHKFKKLNKRYIIGIIGCMAERFNQHLVDLENSVNVVIGPDEYRRMPALLDQALSGNKAVAVELSTVETYDDIIPLRTEGISAWLSIMRGCNNFCSYCVVPYTRGRERSRPMQSLIEETRQLFHKGFREVTLLGQNVNSYKDEETGSTFDILISKIAEISPLLRIRFTTSHPRDMNDNLIQTIAQYPNICKHIHLPVQSGSNRILKKMNRRYTVEHYLSIIDKIKSTIPNSAITTDIIAGYPSETEEDHQQTLELLKQVRFSGAFMFKYSPREGTRAFDEPDDVPEETKIRRLNEIINLQNSISKELNQLEKGRVLEVLVEAPSKKKQQEWMGRSSSNKVVIFPNPQGIYKTGDYVDVLIKKSTSATLFGEVVEKK
ncbi:MAG TPA: tRNA (N6-isopentenyl adenosine(37)-C2)-methylthiotransferase MiaB [Candidatus Kapabacteria bacterium]|nr:tRNA (N6-isopentenyl adenosine(37)-C2)-methylthiotransferase MiaB [Candidatus Kapabacteria bacterium]HOM03870.1 tRNA (N6-isopentenyl adenosine(37)-C2)-methylthiotransferase MiaB [Candidatus Kapabacteria bacterium]HPP39139.1 tRNA (N6-isopentenyl adenosine(37)-C2)-methylthiotransferase MiaB [Candidatus Kapabacteria bacterium]